MKFAIKADAATKSVDIDIYDIVGGGYSYPPCTAQGVRNVLRMSPTAEQINVRIASKGGDAFEGMAIYQQLVDHPARVIVSIDGVAASIASVIAMAGDEIRISPNGFVMVHNAEGGTRGGADEMRGLAELLDKVNACMAATYAARTGQKPVDVAKMMAAETWMTAQEAKELGFVNTILPAKEGSTKKTSLAAFACLEDLGDFLNVPPQVRDLVIAARAESDPPADPAVDPLTLPPRAAPIAREEGPTAMKLSPETLALLGLTGSPDQPTIEAAIKAKCSAPIAASADTMRLLGASTDAQAQARAGDLAKLDVTLLGMTESSTTAEALTKIGAWKLGSEQATALAGQVVIHKDEARISKRDAMIQALARDEVKDGVVIRKAKLPPAMHAWAKANYATAESLETWALSCPMEFGTATVTEQNGGTAIVLSANDKEACRQLGVTEAQFIAQRKLELDAAAARRGV